MNRDVNIIEHMVIHAERIIEKTGKNSLKKFLLNQDEKDIVCFNFIQIGELAKSLSDDYCSQHPAIKWKQLKGTRDKIAHGYGNINFSLIFQYCVDEIPTLLEDCKKFLNSLKEK